MNSYAVLTPYIIPPAMRGKRVNLGDGFILAAIERLLDSFAPDLTFSSRKSPTPAELDRISSVSTVVLGGANQLNRNFSVWPGFTPDDFDRLKVRFVPFGVGLDGSAKTIDFTEAAMDIIRKIHERIEFSSWRCPRTVEALEKALPDLKGRFLMTGCPVVFDRPLLENAQFSNDDARIAVTVTERDDFWEREAETLKQVARLFPRSKRYLVLHQNFGSASRLEKYLGLTPLSSALLSTRAQLHSYARRLGFEIVRPEDSRKCMQFYESIDLHIGSRLHAHLLFLSRNKRSFLTYVDERMTGFAEFLGFHLLAPRHLERELDFDFEIVRTNARSAYETMTRFVRSLDQ